MVVGRRRWLILAFDDGSSEDGSLEDGSSEDLRKHRVRGGITLGCMMTRDGIMGTQRVMLGVMLGNGYYEIGLAILPFMMLLAWDVSGGHFNPALTIGVYVSKMNFGGDAVTMLIMITAQFAGAFFGVFIGWLALLDKVWANSF